MANVSGTTIVCVPGVLTRCQEHHKPLLLERFGRVIYKDYDETFDVPSFVRHVVAEIVQLLRSGQHVVVVGTSVGGMITAFISQSLLDEQVEHDRLKIIINDAPFGLKSFGGFGWMPGWLANSPFSSVAARPVALGIMLAGRLGPGLPKDDEIDTPSADIREKLAWHSVPSDEWPALVKQQARNGLMGHSVGLFARQIRWMPRVERNGSLDEAVRSLVDLDVTYVACIKGNVTVRQPLACDSWLERMGNYDTTGAPRWRSVSGPHVGYLQNQPKWDEVFTDLLG